MFYLFVDKDFKALGKSAGDSIKLDFDNYRALHNRDSAIKFFADAVYQRSCDYHARLYISRISPYKIQMGNSLV
jgi:hypothetical protein